MRSNITEEKLFKDNAHIFLLNLTDASMVVRHILERLLALPSGMDKVMACGVG